MVVDPNINTNEQGKFRSAGPGKAEVCVAVCGNDGGAVPTTPGSLSTDAVINIVALVDTGWTLLPSSELSGRVSIAIQNQSGNDNVILFRYEISGSPPGAGITTGWEIEDGGFKAVLVTDNISVYGRMKSGTGTACVDEIK